MFFAAEDEEALYSQQKQDLELTMTQIMNFSLQNLGSNWKKERKKVQKTTKPFRYDLNQILCDYKVEVMNRFNRLDLGDTVPEEIWTEVHNTVQEVVTKTISKKKIRKKAKSLSDGYLQIAEKRNERQGRKCKTYSIKNMFQRIGKRDTKTFL